MARISGKDLAIYLWDGSGFARVLDAYEVGFTYEDVLLDASIKGDTAERMMPSHFRGRLTAKRWVEDAANALVLAKAAASQSRVEFAILGIDPISDSTASVFSTTSVRIHSTGYVTRGEVILPREGAQDNWELVLDSIPAEFA